MLVLFVAEGQGRTALFQINNIADEIIARNHKHHAEVLVLEQIYANAEQKRVNADSRRAKYYFTRYCAL